MMMEDSRYTTRYQVLEDSSIPRNLGAFDDELRTHTLPDTGLSSSGESRRSGGGGLGVQPVVPQHIRRWSHINDLDDFFKRIYRYHQSGGFRQMVLHEFLDIFTFVFVIILTLYCLCGIDYQVLFANESVQLVSNSTMEVVHGRLSDAIYPISQMFANMSKFLLFLLIVAILFLVVRVLYALHNLFQYWETRDFFVDALSIPENNLKNVTWDEVKLKLMDVQQQHQMCVHKSILTSLDIYQRILRHENYMIALINRNVIPVEINVPFIGRIIYLTKAYEFNINLLLFFGSHSLLQKHKMSELRNHNKKRAVTEEFEKKILQLAVLNFVLMPFIFIYQLLYSLYHNVERMRSEPGSFAGRQFSNYGRVYVRHYNELSHELTARLNRAHKPASVYMSNFYSSWVNELIGTVNFLCGAVAAVLLFLGAYDNDVWTREGFLTMVTVFTAVTVMTRNLLPDENLVWVPELLMNRVVGQIHYMPCHWMGKTHTTQVRDEFGQLFQYKFMNIVEELVSPIVTPFMLLFCLRPCSSKIIDFFQMFSVEVDGIGTVCSFAQMDIKQHGSPNWQPTMPTPPSLDDDDAPLPVTATIGPAPDGGRTELSLVHFALTNPDWRPPKAGQNFLKALKNCTAAEIADHAVGGLPGVAEHSLTHSINSLNLTATEKQFRAEVMSDVQNFTVRGYNGGVARTEGPLQSSVYSDPRQSMHSSLAYSNQGQMNCNLMDPNDQQVFDPLLLSPQPQSAVDMSINCFYLQRLSRIRMERQQYHDSSTYRPSQLTDHRSSIDEGAEAAAYTDYHAQDSFVAERPFNRTPSPPPGDPFIDAMMSQMGASGLPSSHLASPYPLYGTSDQASQRPLRGPPRTDSASDATPLIPHSRR